jgi:hypothetical protein
MALPPLRVAPSSVLRTEDAATTDAQRQQFVTTARVNATTTAVNTIRATPFGTDGQMLTQPDGRGDRTQALTLVAGNNVIEHTLRRPALGFVVADLQAVASPLALTRVERSRLVDEQSILLHASAACTAKIWVW